MGILLRTGQTGEQRAEQFAHVLRRATFGPFPGQLSRSLDAYPDTNALLDGLLAAPPLPFDPHIMSGGKVTPVDIDLPDVEGDLEHYMRFRPWWVRRMSRDDAGLHEVAEVAEGELVERAQLAPAQVGAVHLHA